MEPTGKTEATRMVGFEVLFDEMKRVKYADLVKASEEIAKLSEPIQALAEATAEIAKPRFTTFISA